MSVSKDGKGNGRAKGDEEIVKEEDPKTSGFDENKCLFEKKKKHSSSHLGWTDVDSLWVKRQKEPNLIPCMYY